MIRFAQLPMQQLGNRMRGKLLTGRIVCNAELSVSRDAARRYPVQAIALRYLGIRTAFPPRQPEKRDFELLRLKSNLRAGGTRL
jgi:hypothetical protein